MVASTAVALTSADFAVADFTVSGSAAFIVAIAFHRGYAFHRGLAFHRGFGFRRGFAFHRGYAFHRGFWGHRYFFHRRVFFGYPRYWHGYGCLRWRHVLTPWGWRLHRVNVCGFRY